MVAVFDPAVAKRIRLLGLDVDGVLTDNAVFVGDLDGARVEFKRFNIQDGLGLVLLRGSGVDVAWISGRVSAATAHRGVELKVDTVLQVPATEKVPVIGRLLEERGLAWDEMAFVGDDIADLPVMQRVGLPIAVANARDEVKAACHYVTRAEGGHGAVREVVDRLLYSRGEWAEALVRYFDGVRPAS